MVEDTGVKLLLLRVDDVLVGLRLSAVIETLRPLPCTRLSGVPAFVLGLSVIRGLPTPVIDLGALLGHGSTGDLSRFVTVRVGPRAVALGVDRVVGVRAVDERALERLPPLLAASGDQVGAIAVLDRELVSVLETGRLITGDLLTEIGEAS